MTVNGEIKPYHNHFIGTFLPKMLKHWGLELKDGAIKVFDMDLFNRYINNQNNHNQLRFSRVCTCLNAFKDTKPKIKTAFQVLKTFVETPSNFTNVSLKSKEAWINAVR